MTSAREEIQSVAPTTMSSGDALLALLLGIGFDLGFNQPRHGLSVALFAIAAALVLRVRVGRDRQDDLLLFGAVTLAAFSAVRAAEWVVVLNVLTACALVVGVVARTETPLFGITIFDLLRRAGHVFAGMLHAPAGLLVPLGRALGGIGSRRLRRIVRAGALTVPVLLLFATLLASADRIFGSIITPALPSLDLGDVTVHAWWIGSGALLAMTAFAAARRPVSAFPETQRLPRALAPVEWSSVLIGVDALFALFVAIQFAFLFGGDERVRVTDGLTYAEYARSGFFQLLAVAVLVVVLIVGLWDLGQLDTHRRRFNYAVTALIGLTGVILASAAFRMVLYERAFGSTVLRLLAMIAIAAIAIVLLGILAMIWLDKRQHVVALLCCCFVVGLATLSLINPEYLVAERNVKRFEKTGKVDVAYLTNLGPDAVEPSSKIVRSLPRTERDLLRAHLCAQTEGRETWATANLGRSRAQRARAVLRCAPPPRGWRPDLRDALRLRRR